MTRSRIGISRATTIFLGLALALYPTLAAKAQQNGKLNYIGIGGPTQEALRKAYFEPFQEGERHPGGRGYRPRCRADPGGGAVRASDDRRHQHQRGSLRDAARQGALISRSTTNTTTPPIRRAWPRGRSATDTPSPRATPRSAPQNPKTPKPQNPNSLN